MDCWNIGILIYDWNGYMTIQSYINIPFTIWEAFAILTL